MAWIFGLFSKNKDDVPMEKTPKETVYLTQTVVFGRDDSSVCFVNESLGIRKLLVDAKGRIQHFPGIVQEDFWVKCVPANLLSPQIRYRTSFEKRGDKWLMLWTLQPDGDYWRDSDGFGAEDEEEVILHTYVDGNGNFTGPFRIYELGQRCYSLDRFELAHTKYYTQALQALKSGEIAEHVDVLFPRLYGMELSVGIRKVWEYYTLWTEADAADYWRHPVLSRHLTEAAETLLKLDLPVTDVFGYPFYKIVHSCMTLFYLTTGERVFGDVLDQCFGGKKEEFTQKRLSLLKK